MTDPDRAVSGAVSETCSCARECRSTVCDADCLVDSRKRTELLLDLLQRTEDEGPAIGAPAPENPNEAHIGAARNREYSRPAVTAANSRRDESLTELLDP